MTVIFEAYRKLKGPVPPGLPLVNVTQEVLERYDIRRLGESFTRRLLVEIGTCGLLPYEIRTRAASLITEVCPEFCPGQKDPTLKQLAQYRATHYA